MKNKLVKGRSYTNNNTDLALKMLSNVFESATQLKFKGLLYNKKNGIIYETKQYKLEKNTPLAHNWKVVDSTIRRRK